MISFTFTNPEITYEHLGMIPSFIEHSDPRPAADQIHENYAHGGGWRPFTGFTMNQDGSISYPGERDLIVLAEAQFRDETLRYYEYSWFAIVQPDGSYEISRLN